MFSKILNLIFYPFKSKSLFFVIENLFAPFDVINEESRSLELAIPDSKR